MLTERLLEPAVKFVALSRLDLRDRALSEQRAEHGIGDGAGKNQIFVEGRLQNARVGNAQHSTCALDVVRNSRAGLRLPSPRKSPIHVKTDTQVEGPVAFGNHVLNVAGVLFDIGAAMESKQASLRRGASIIERWGPCQIETAQQGNEWRRRIGVRGHIRLKPRACALRRIVECGVAGPDEGTGNVLRNTRIVDGWVGKAKFEIFRQKRVLECDAGFDVVYTLQITNV